MMLVLKYIIVNQFELDIARQGLEAYSVELSPFYSGLREQLNDRLTTHERGYEDLRAANLNAQANAWLIAQTVELLPHTSGPAVFTNEFAIDDIYSAQALQASTLWYRAIRYWDGNPYFIVGTAALSSRRSSLLLQTPATNDESGKTVQEPGDLATATISTKKLERIEAAQAKLLSMQPDQTDIEELFDKKLNGLLVDGESKNAVPIYPVSSHSGIYLHGLKIKGAPVRGLSGRSNGYPAPGIISDGISDETMGSHDVFHRLTRLSSIFGVTNLFKELLDQYEHKIHSTTTDKLLDEEHADQARLISIEVGGKRVRAWGALKRRRGLAGQG